MPVIRVLTPSFSSADVLSINMLLTPATQELFNRELIYGMKKGAHLVNAAREG